MIKTNYIKTKKFTKKKYKAYPNKSSNFHQKFVRLINFNNESEKLKERFLMLFTITLHLNQNSLVCLWGLILVLIRPVNLLRKASEW